MNGARIGTFEDLMAETVEPMRPVARALRDLVLGVDPNAVEVVRLGDRAATYGLGPKKMSEGYTYILPYTSWVNLSFYRGAELPDPDHLLQGTGARLRHVKVHGVNEAGQPSLRALIHAALVERATALATPSG